VEREDVEAEAPARAVEDVGADARASAEPSAEVAPRVEGAPLRSAAPAEGTETPADGPPPASARPVTSRASPSFARRGMPGPLDARMRRQRRALTGAVGALGLLLGLQVLLADRARLASDPGWRPALVRLCGVLRCSLPPWREPTALTVLARDVRPDASRPGVLLATATFRNDARWAQAWPRLRLTLSDIDGRTVGTRVFTAQEYFATPPQPVLAAGDSADVRLQLVEPDARAVSFAFDFL